MEIMLEIFLLFSLGPQNCWGPQVVPYLCIMLSPPLGSSLNAVLLDLVVKQCCDQVDQRYEAF